MWKAALARRARSPPRWRLRVSPGLQSAARGQRPPLFWVPLRFGRAGTPTLRMPCLAATGARPTFGAESRALVRVRSLRGPLRRSGPRAAPPSLGAFERHGRAKARQGRRLDVQRRRRGALLRTRVEGLGFGPCRGSPVRGLSGPTRSPLSTPFPPSPSPAPPRAPRAVRRAGAGRAVACSQAAAAGGRSGGSSCGHGPCYAARGRGTRGPAGAGVAGLARRPEPADGGVGAGANGLGSSFLGRPSRWWLCTGPSALGRELRARGAPVALRVRVRLVGPTVVRWAARTAFGMHPPPRPCGGGTPPGTDPGAPRRWTETARGPCPLALPPGWYPRSLPVSLLASRRVSVRVTEAKGLGETLSLASEPWDVCSPSPLVTPLAWATSSTPRACPSKAHAPSRAGRPREGGRGGPPVKGTGSTSLPSLLSSRLATSFSSSSSSAERTEIR